MATIIINNPQASAPVESRPLLMENRKICALKPTEQTQCALIILIQRLFYCILNWLYPFERTPYIAIVHALDANSNHLPILGKEAFALSPSTSHFPTLGKEALVRYFRRFVHEDTAVSQNLNRCVDALKEQYETIEIYERKKSDLSSKERKKFSDLLGNWAEKVQQLQEGQQSLIVANDATEDELFYLFSHKNGHTHLKLIGRGASLAALAKTGNSEVISSIDYGAVSKTFISEALLECSPLGTRALIPEDFEVLLQKYGITAQSSSQVEPKRQAHVDLFLTLFNQIETNSGKTAKECARMELRVEVFTLFSLLKEMRQRSTFAPHYLHALEQMLRICSQNLYRAFQSQHINQEESTALVAELAEVQNRLEAAQNGTKATLHRPSMPAMDVFPLKTLNLQTPPSETTTPRLTASSTAPLPVPVFNTQKQLIRTPVAMQPLPILEQLEALVDNDISTPHLIYTIYRIQLRQEDIDSKAHAKKCIQHLSTLSKRLVQTCLREQSLSLDAYEALIKMGQMLALLAQNHLGTGARDQELTNWLQRGARMLNNGRYGSEQTCMLPRIGYTLHSGNIATYFKRDEFRGSLTGTASESDQEVRAHLEMQVQLLHHLSKFGYSTYKYATPFSNFYCDYGPLLPCHYQWTTPIPTSLLAAYMGSNVIIGGNDGQPKGRNNYIHRYHLITQANFDGNFSPEYIQHDPKSALSAGRIHYLEGGLKDWLTAWERIFAKPISPFADLQDKHVVMKMTQQRMNLLKWQHNITRAAVLAVTAGKGKPFEDDEHFIFTDEVLGESPFTETVIDEQYQGLLAKQKEYLRRCDQLEKEIELSNEERTALLSLLREKEPQREVLAFIETHAALLTQPAIQAYIELIFFHPSLIDLVKDDQNHVFYQLIPAFLEEKIAFYMRKKEKQPSDMSMLLFLVRMSERLKGIYLELQPRYPQICDTAKFLPMYDPELQAYLQAGRTGRLSPLDRCTLLACHLKALFAKERLSQKEICQMTLDMQLLQKEAENCPPTERCDWELFSLRESYQRVIKELENQPFLESTQVDFLLNTLCQRAGCTLQPSSWTGKWPQLSNEFYRIDLSTLAIEDLHSALMVTVLPSGIVNTPMFTKAFPDMRHQVIQATKKRLPDGTDIYCFEDRQKGACRIECQGNSMTLYRSFPQISKPQFFQAVTLVEPPPISAEEMSMQDLASPETSNKKKQAPSLLQGTAFIDPQSLMGYTLSSTGTPELQVQLKRTLFGKKIQSVIDLRLTERVPMQLTTLDEVSDPALKQLTQIEDPAHIHVWGKKGGSVEKIELPRYGLHFSIQNGKLTCTNPEYAGYTICFGATLRERRGITHSLLLKHSDRTRPKKLLFPSASVFSKERRTERPYSGLALVIRFFQYLCSRTSPEIEMKQFIYSQWRLDTSSPSLPYSVIDLRVHTEELAYHYGKEIEEQQELILQAFLEDNIHLALEVIDSIEVGSEEKQIRKWIEFLSSLEPEQNVQKAALALKLSEKIYPRIQGQPQYKKLIDRLMPKVRGWMMQCMKQQDALPATLKPKLPDPSAAFAVNENVLNTPLLRESLGRELDIIQPAPLVFERSTLNNQTIEKLRETVSQKREEIEKEKEKAKVELATLLQDAHNPAEQLGIWGLEKRLPTFSELCLSLMQNDLESLRAKLPQSTDRGKLRKTLIRFFDTEVQFHFLLRCEEELNKTSTVSENLLDQLAYKREYDPEKHPELLAFEAFNFVVFRNTMTPSQLQLLKELLSAPSSIVQAGTGSGKSAVLSVLRGLMRANGANLVTQMVLPHLWQETLTILTQRLGGVFKRKVYPLLFTPSMPMQDDAGNPLCKTIYFNLLETIRNKGCILTDYKSFPFLEEKFIALSKIISGDQLDNRATPRSILENWFYLLKILVLLQGRGDGLMDEFDQPLSAVQQIQTQIKENQGYEEWKLTTALELFKVLKEDPLLLLEQNLQGDIPDDQRTESIIRLARHMAKKMAHGNATEALLFAYFTEESEAVLDTLNSWSQPQKDKLAFIKEECVTFLPLTLNRSALSNYRQSKAGNGIVVCSKGQPRSAKFKNMEEINYLIQAGLQQKIAYPALRSYLVAAKRDWIADPVGAQARINPVLPGVSLKDLAALSPDAFEDQVDEILISANKNTATVFYFLDEHLKQLKKPGVVISMDPQASVSMSFAVSGVSATTGSLGSLHQQFKTDKTVAEKIQKQQLDRLRTRSYGKPTTYDPLHPLKIFDTIKDIPDLCALIDASGAFRSVPPEDVARALLKANKTLKRVDYYDKDGDVASIGYDNKDSITSIDVPEVDLSQRGFYFPEAQTRGSDQVLNPNGVALLLTGKKGDTEAFIQEEGRMRHANQKILVALPYFDALPTLNALIDYKLAYQRAAHADDRYRAEIQRLSGYVRAAARKALLEIDLADIEALFTMESPSFEDIQGAFAPYLDRFGRYEALFIQQSENQEAPGHYFNKHKHLIKPTSNVAGELLSYKAMLLERCKALGIQSKDLETYIPPTEDCLPRRAPPIGEVENQEQEVELEMQQEQETQTAQQNESDKAKLDYYPSRASLSDHFTRVKKLHDAFDPVIAFEYNFLPLDRMDSLHQRQAWDDRTGRIGTVEIVYYYETGEILSVHIGDLLDEVDPMRSPYSLGETFRYDIRLNRVTKGELGTVNQDELARLIAQVKFFDGMYDHYTPQEIAHLSRWLEENTVETMHTLFTKTILKNRPGHRFAHSQLDQLFKKAQKAAN